MVCPELSLPEQGPRLLPAISHSACRWLRLPWTLKDSVGLVGPGAPLWRCRLFPEGRANPTSTSPWARDVSRGGSSLIRFQGPTSKELQGLVDRSPGMLCAGWRVRGEDPPPTRAALTSGCEGTRGQRKIPTPV